MLALASDGVDECVDFLDRHDAADGVKVRAEALRRLRKSTDKQGLEPYDRFLAKAQPGKDADAARAAKVDVEKRIARGEAAEKARIAREKWKEKQAERAKEATEKAKIAREKWKEKQAERAKEAQERYKHQQCMQVCLGMVIACGSGPYFRKCIPAIEDCRTPAPDDCKSTCESMPD